MAFRLKDGSGQEHEYSKEKLKIPSTIDGEFEVFTKGEVQEMKTVDIISTAPDDISPDDGYDSMKSVRVFLPIEALVDGGTYTSETYAETESAPSPQTITISPSSGFLAAEMFSISIDPVPVPSIQGNKVVPIETLGHTTITPDDGYSAMRSVDIEVSGSYAPEKTKLSKDKTVNVQCASWAILVFMLNENTPEISDAASSYFSEIAVDVTATLGTTTVTITVTWSADLPSTAKSMWTASASSGMVFSCMAGSVTVLKTSSSINDAEISITPAILTTMESLINDWLSSIVGTSIEAEYTNWVYSTNI